MKYHLPCKSFHYFRLTLFLFLIFLAANVCAQIPEGIPKETPSVPLDSPLGIVMYIVFPALVVGYYFWWRKGNKNKQGGQGLGR